MKAPRILRRVIRDARRDAGPRVPRLTRLAVAPPDDVDLAATFAAIPALEERSPS